MQDIDASVAMSPEALEICLLMWSFNRYFLQSIVLSKV